MCQNDVRHLAHGVYDIHDHVIAVRLWEFNYEVDTDGVPMGLWSWEQRQFSDRQTPLCFGAEADVTCLHILTDVTRHLWPSVIPGD